ncbi:hypothetical protein P153DRAFT_389074 [Dothidotthia symphoricarpi CBS 119687]|uniref:Uncharacterized protein n=1 Tax=Dothidotthia symphoricarpi CBS 119687 TaxID=1392245 RepID=A0A6A6A0U7_9PLEO|nr:uncharacterized protein P153DRAFT_389074 [Dothidotthia symphoricarpi CBS 119687]KAF2125622.1 hypothetical protein P153DRAFT_389074 [Dothidotthia symphoricarpi CBS 119687]
MTNRQTVVQVIERADHRISKLTSRLLHVSRHEVDVIRTAKRPSTVGDQSTSDPINSAKSATSIVPRRPDVQHAVLSSRSNASLLKHERQLRYRQDETSDDISWVRLSLSPYRELDRFSKHRATHVYQFGWASWDGKLWSNGTPYLPYVTLAAQIYHQQIMLHVLQTRKGSKKTCEKLQRYKLVYHASRAHALQSIMPFWELYSEAVMTNHLLRGTIVLQHHRPSLAPHISSLQAVLTNSIQLLFTLRHDIEAVRGLRLLPSPSSHGQRYYDYKIASYFTMFEYQQHLEQGRHRLKEIRSQVKASSPLLRLRWTDDDLNLLYFNTTQEQVDYMASHNPHNQELSRLDSLPCMWPAYTIWTRLKNLCRDAYNTMAKVTDLIGAGMHLTLRSMPPHARPVRVRFFNGCRVYGMRMMILRTELKELNEHFYDFSLLKCTNTTVSVSLALIAKSKDVHEAFHNIMDRNRAQRMGRRSSIARKMTRAFKEKGAMGKPFIQPPGRGLAVGKIYRSVGSTNVYRARHAGSND